MTSRGNGGTPRQEPKRKTGKRGSTGKKKGGAGGVSAGWWKHPDLARVDHDLLRRLHQWSARQTFKHQFRVAATKRPPVAQTSPARFENSPPPRPPVQGLAAVKYAQEQRANRAAALAETLHRQQHSQPTRRGDTPSSMGELYQYYKRLGKLDIFFALFPG